jgi:ABC-type glycerol-3-phosphate transport system substrate-binding protein
MTAAKKRAASAKAAGYPFTGLYTANAVADRQIQQALTDAINRVLAGSQTPKAALDRAQNEAQDAIDSAT